jgi:hypothetical protein
MAENPTSTPGVSRPEHRAGARPPHRPIHPRTPGGDPRPRPRRSTEPDPDVDPPIRARTADPPIRSGTPTHPPDLGRPSPTPAVRADPPTDIPRRPDPPETRLRPPARTRHRSTRPFALTSGRRPSVAAGARGGCSWGSVRPPRGPGSPPTQSWSAPHGSRRPGAGPGSDVALSRLRPGDTPGCRPASSRLPADDHQISGRRRSGRSGHDGRAAGRPPSPAPTAASTPRAGPMGPVDSPGSGLRGADFRTRTRAGRGSATGGGPLVRPPSPWAAAGGRGAARWGGRGRPRCGGGGSWDGPSRLPCVGWPVGTAAGAATTAAWDGYGMTPRARPQRGRRTTAGGAWSGRLGWPLRVPPEFTTEPRVGRHRPRWVDTVAAGRGGRVGAPRSAGRPSS